MTLDKHEIQGVQRIGCKVLPISTFEELVIKAGYYKTATAPSFGTRVKVWFVHKDYGRLECVYDLSVSKCITAYHK